MIELSSSFTALDETRTCFAPVFSFDKKLYPGANNPDLDGKPVLVLAVKSNQGICYLFNDLSELLKAMENEPDVEENEGDNHV